MHNINLQLKPNFPDAEDQSPCIIGTHPFMALEILSEPRVHHTRSRILFLCAYMVMHTRPLQKLGIMGVRCKICCHGGGKRCYEEINLHQEFIALKDLAFQFRDYWYLGLSGYTFAVLKDTGILGDEALIYIPKLP